MSTCCETTETSLPKTGTLIVALAGNPNSGKTTIFNALTGLRQKVANYPGVTVEKKTGRCWIDYPAPAEGQINYKQAKGTWANVIDLPGTYSLISRSPDEHVAMEVLRGLRPDTPAPDVVIAVVDASNLQRNLYLVSQLIELGRPLVIALNMMDIAERRGLKVSPARLEKELGVPVVPVVGHRKTNIAALKAEILRAKVAPLPDWPLPEAMHEELLVVGGALAILNSAPAPSPGTPGEGGGEGSAANGSHLAHGKEPSPYPLPEYRERDRPLDRYLALSERLLIGDRAADIAHIAAAKPVASLLDHATNRLSQLGIDPMQADIEAHYRWIDTIAAGAMEPACAVLLYGQENTVEYDSTTKHRLDYASKIASLTEKVDHVLLHKVWGLAVFALIMVGLFITIFSLADPIMGATEDGIGWLGSLVASHMPDGALKDLWTDGIVAGVGGVVVFVPQIAILFLFLAILEDSGYLARAAFLMDRLLSKVGLHGKSFIPLLSSFACAIPGIMACRTIENRKDRLATIFVAPFMSCSARLPVYTLLIGAFFASYSSLVQGGIMFAMYAIGVLAAVVTAWIFKRSLLKGAPQSFILELPAYKVPQVGQVVRSVWTNTKAFLVKAGTIIFALSVILWAMSYYPRLTDQEKLATESTARDRYAAMIESGPKDEVRPTAGSNAAEADKLAEEAVASEQLRRSIAGRFGHFVEPVIRPLGYDWKMGVGLVGAFAAREVFVSTMNIVYSAGASEDDTKPLEAVMLADTYPDGRKVWTPLVAVSLLVWFVLAMQCMSTLAIVKRETGGWLWPLGMLLYMNGLAWVVCFGIYQIGRVWFV